MYSTRYYSASRTNSFDLMNKPKTAIIDDDDLYSGFNEVAPALDTKNLKQDVELQETLKTAGFGKKAPSRSGTGFFRQGAIGLRLGTGARTATAGGNRPLTAARAAGYTPTSRSTPTSEEKKEDTLEEKLSAMEKKIMALVEESCCLSVKPEDYVEGDGKSDSKITFDPAKALAKAQEASSLERQLIKMQEQGNMGDSHNLDLTFVVLCNLAGQYTLNEMYTEALNTYQLLTRNKLFPNANRLKVNMGNIYFKMGEHPKALKLYRMALDQTPTAEKDLRMKVMHNIGLLLVRMGKFRDAFTNFQHMMHEQPDSLTGLHLVLCCVALNDAEAGKAAFHAMLDVEIPTYHHEIPINDENDPYEAMLRDVMRGDKLSQWSRRTAAHAERCLAQAASALAPLLAPQAPRDDDSGMWWCVEALRGWEAGGPGARLELGAALGTLRGVASASAPAQLGMKASQRLKAVARANNNDRVIKAEANADAAFISYALGNISDAKQLATAAAKDDPYCSSARITAALATAKESGSTPEDWRQAAQELSAAHHLDPADLVTMHTLALSLEFGGVDLGGAVARWSRLRSTQGTSPSLRMLAAACLGRVHQAASDTTSAEHWYSSVGTWDAGVTSALARLHSDSGDITTARHYYQDVESVWPCDIQALEWLGSDARGSDPNLAMQYYKRAARLQPSNPQWGLQIGACLRASGKYQEALSLYKKLNRKFPDNVQCLKLIVKLCGDQGLPETTAWSKELQRAQARLKQQERASMASATSVLSGSSQSPVDQVRGIRTESANRSRLSTASSGPIPTPLPRNRGALEKQTSEQSLPTSGGIGQQDTPKPAGRNINAPNIKKRQNFDDDLPLPLE